MTYPLLHFCEYLRLERTFSFIWTKLNLLYSKIYVSTLIGIDLLILEDFFLIAVYFHSIAITSPLRTGLPFITIWNSLPKVQTLIKIKPAVLESKLGCKSLTDDGQSEKLICFQLTWARITGKSKIQNSEGNNV
jgi:hypothetical protein